MFRSKLVAIVTASLLLTASGVWLSSNNPPMAQAEEAQDSKLKELLNEKLSILREVASQTIKAYEQGVLPAQAYEVIPAAQVYEAKQAVHKAELDLCDTNKERVAVLEKMLIEAKDFEKSVKREVKSGGLGTIHALRAKVKRLDVEIALERAKRK